MVNDAYMMKLGWGLMAKKESLWAQVLQFKYGCRNLLVPSVKLSSQVSHLWQGICHQWSYVEKGILWVVKCGHGVRFWLDPWVPEMGILSNHALVDISDNARNYYVSAYSENGGWNWAVLQLPSHVCSKIASLQPPEESLDDYPIWRFAADGVFSLRSAFEVLYDDSISETPTFNFTAI